MRSSSAPPTIVLLALIQLTHEQLIRLPRHADHFSTQRYDKGPTLPTDQVDHNISPLPTGCHTHPAG